MSSNPYRLPRSVLPRLYSLRLKPDFATYTFTGQVDTQVQVVESVTSVVLHALELEVSTISYQSSTATSSVSIEQFSHDEDKQFLTLTLPQAIEPGLYTFHFEFKGTLNDKMVGFYRSKYVLNGEEKYMATTQFESTDARRCFPCWDEPDMKATFQTTLVVPVDKTAVSNTPVEEERMVEDNCKSLRFGVTPIMSTYLLAFVIGDLEYVEGHTKEGIQVRVYTTPGKKDQGLFGLDVAVKVLSFFSDYFGIAYPLTKCDLLAIPDFAAGAMENWGCITFREVALLVSETLSSAATKQYVASVVAHELAHQWFGNLVTMEWWSDLWLNEGFSTWAGYLAVDHCFPEWEIFLEFTSSSMAYCMKVDGLKSSHPIEIPIEDPKLISQVFDALSYSKGACIIRMIENYLSAEVFQTGLRSYLNQHKYANAKTADLWASLEHASGRALESMATGWTTTTGFPVVLMETSADDKSLLLRQKRFLSSGPVQETDTEEISKKWKIPVSYCGCRRGTNEKLTSIVELEGDSVHIPSDSLQEFDWVKFNVGQTGLYRVHYSSELWSQLRTAVEQTAIGPVDRLGLVMDMFAFSKAGMLSAELLLDMAYAFRMETEYAVWAQLATDLDELSQLVSSTPAAPHFDTFMQRMFETIGNKLGWEAQAEESHQSSILRALALKNLGSFGHQETIQECKNRFRMLVQDFGSISADLKPVVMNVAAKYGGREEFEQIKKLFNSIDSAEFKVKCVMAMGQVREPQIIDEFIQWIFQNVRPQDILYGFVSLSSNPMARGRAWAYVKSNWTAIRKMFSDNMIEHMATIPLRGFSTEQAAVDAEQFFAECPVPEAKMGITRQLENIRTKAAWLQRDEAAISAWLQRHMI
eukprot:GILK01005323.1.p1 GENE.GILK01005323.1~~GILK01005323.1.p1  ORF type:complete len:892 (+),score=188.23 GILK01005323.1:73-2676(+)